MISSKATINFFNIYLPLKCLIDKQKAYLYTKLAIQIKFKAD